MEIWRDIPDYEGYYQASNLGRIRSVNRTLKDGRYINGVTLCVKYDKYGYTEVSLHKNGNRKTFKVHRLICATFIKEENGKSIVNHKNGIRDDNRAVNLEWCDNSFNQWHRCHINHNPPDNSHKRKRVIAIMPNGFKYYFNSVTECSEFFRVSRTAIERKLKGKSPNPSFDSRRQCVVLYGIKFEYVV